MQAVRYVVCTAFCTHGTELMLFCTLGMRLQHECKIKCEIKKHFRREDKILRMYDSWQTQNDRRMDMRGTTKNVFYFILWFIACIKHSYVWYMWMFLKWFTVRVQVFKWFTVYIYQVKKTCFIPVQVFIKDLMV